MRTQRGGRSMAPVHDTRTHGTRAPAHPSGARTRRPRARGAVARASVSRSGSGSGSSDRPATGRVGRAIATHMGKSIRSKIKRKFRAIKAAKYAPVERRRLERVVRNLPVNRHAPPVPDEVDPNGTPKPSFSFWSVVREMDEARRASQPAAAESAARGAAATPQPMSVVDGPDDSGPDALTKLRMAVEGSMETDGAPVGKRQRRRAMAQRAAQDRRRHRRRRAR